METAVRTPRPASRFRDKRVSAPWIGLSGAVAGLLLGACGEPELQPVPPPPYTILPGAPEAIHEPVGVHRGEAEEQPIRISRPRLCETFSFPWKSGAVDLLFVPDVGRSVTRDDLLGAYVRFVDRLGANPELSIRIGVVSTDPVGSFVPIAGSDLPYVTCSLAQVGGCVVGDQLVGWNVARDVLLTAIDRARSAPASLGLLAVVEALEGPTGASFLRPDAELHVVVVADSDDASCLPRRAGSRVACTSFDACGCASDLASGDVEWFVRYLRNVKGHGFAERVRFSAWVATASDPLTTGEESGVFVGCAVGQKPGSCATPWSGGVACALYAPRYAAVTRAFGGILGDICSEPDGLPRIGAHVAGVAPEFHLQRKPLPSTIETVLLSFPDEPCNHRDSCLEDGLDCIRGRCGSKVSAGGADGWQYVSCSNEIPTRMVRLEDSDRLSNRRIEICYDVDVGADPLCP